MTPIHKAASSLGAQVNGGTHQSHCPMVDNVDTELFRNKRKLKDLRIEHRDLDDVIDRLSHDSHVDQLQLRRLKKRKLFLKDLITKIESELIPDLNA